MQQHDSNLRPSVRKFETDDIPGTAAADTTVSTPPADLKSVTEIKPTACPPRTIYSVERLPNGYTRITQNGRVTFNGLMGRVTA